MKLAQNVLKAAIVGLSALLLIAMFFPFGSSTSNITGEISKIYLYETLLGGSYIFINSVNIYILIALIFGTVILFTHFKSKDMMAAGFLLLSCLYLLFICLYYSHNMKLSSTNYVYEKNAGYYLIFIASCLQIIAAITHAVICLLKPRFEKQNPENGAIG